MPSVKQFWLVLVIALAQAVLGGAVLVTNTPEPAPAPGASGAPADAAPNVDPGPPQGETPAMGATPEIPGETPAPVGSDRAPTTSAAAPGSDAPQAPAPLPIHSTYEQLKPEEQANVDGGGADNAIVEGRVDDGLYWRLSAHSSGDKVCPEKSYHDPQRRSGGSGGGGCSPNSEWHLAGGGPAGDYGYLGMHGFAPAEAHRFELTAKDGRRGSIGGVYKPEMGGSFFVAWLSCDGPDLERIDALAADGRVVVSYNFAKELPGVGWPSWPCNPGGK